MVKININEVTVEELRDIVIAIEHYTAHVEQGTDVEQIKEMDRVSGKVPGRARKTRKEIRGEEVTSTDWAAAAAFGFLPSLRGVDVILSSRWVRYSSWALGARWDCYILDSDHVMRVRSSALMHCEEIKEERTRENELRIHELRRIIERS